jgi:putative FmdB family regulatory protein
MPIYEYACEGCGHRFEKFQSITAAPVDTCPACHQEHVRRLISASSFQLKGGGWYVTDYGRAGRRSDSARSGKDGEKAAHTAA